MFLNETGLWRKHARQPEAGSDFKKTLFVVFCFTESRQVTIQIIIVANRFNHYFCGACIFAG
jgi:hypothetical protein